MKANLKVNNSFGLVYTDLMRPNSPRALGDYEYGSKFTDEYINRREVCLIQTKREAGYTIQPFVKWGAALFAFVRTEEQSIREALPGSTATKQRSSWKLLPPTRLARLA